MPELAALKVDEIAARLERLPLTAWQVRARLIIGVATFFDAFDALSIAYILPALIGPWHLNPGQIALTISIGYVGQLVGALLAGWLAERYGRRNTMVLCVIIYSVCSLLLALSWNYPSLLAFRIVQGLGLGGEVPLAASYISEIAKAHGRGRFVLFYELVFPLGLVAVALAGYWIVPNIGWRWLFVIGALSGLVVFFMQTRLPESPRWLASVGRVEDAEVAITYIEKQVQRSSHAELPQPRNAIAVKENKQLHWDELFSHMYLRRTLVIWLIWFAAYLANYGLTTWLPSIYSTIYKLPLQTSLGYTLATIALGLLGTVACALLIDKVGRRLWIAGALIVAAIFLLILWSFGRTSAFNVFVWSTLSYICIGSVSLAAYVYTPELYPTRMRAFGTSVATAWLRLASIIGPFIVGAILAWSNLSWVFLVFGAVALVAGIITALFAIETRERILEEVSP